MRGDVMLHILPPSQVLRGRPPKGEDARVFYDLARAGRMSRTYANRVYKTSNYFPRKSELRSSLIDAGVEFTFANIARQKVPDGVEVAVEELLHAKDQIT